MILRTTKDNQTAIEFEMTFVLQEVEHYIMS